MLDQPNRPWTSADTADLYNLPRWGRNYFSVDAEGYLTVDINQSGRPDVRLVDIVQHYAKQGTSPPMIIRFPGIIGKRTDQINLAFQSAINSYGYQGKYRLFYPVKVNQHHEVISAAIAAGAKYGGGLEAGSKAELMAVIAMANPETPLLCNGFKDKTVIEMALRALKLGRDMTIVIEKPNELDLVLELSKKMGIRPRLGIRVKVSSKGGGHWSSSGGSRSKFGLSVPELTVAIERLDSAGYLDCLHLLHFHPGSQITNVRKIKDALVEMSRVYCNLIEYGVPIKTIDVGGGLAVDYTGNQNKELSSMNYTLREYANDVVYQIQSVCDEADKPHPDIYSESGRALVAHHSMLIVPIIGTSQSTLDNLDDAAGRALVAVIDRENEVQPDDHIPLRELREIYQELNERNLLESYHDAQAMLEMALQMFSNGMFDIWHRSYAERTGLAICKKINSLLDNLDFVPRELEQLQNALSDTYFGNFSLFQALPDAWALKQLFPVMPIHRLNERPTIHAVLGDITCDSDGKIDCFIGDFGDRESLAMHSLNCEPYYIGVFLIGAYQEALSDDHNLMGKFHITTIHDPHDPSTWEFVQGSDLEDVLVHVHHDTDRLQRNLIALVDHAQSRGLVNQEEATESLAFFTNLKNSYTYLTNERSR
jgi:arginine decarboxylase